MAAASSGTVISLSSSVTSLPSIPAPLQKSDISTLHPVKLFTLSSSTNKGRSTPFTSISHNPQGTFFITTSPNGSLQLYDTLRARPFKTTYSKKYGCSNAIFTLRSATESTPTSCVISSSIPASSDSIANNALRFLDLNTNSFIRYFQSHTKQVTSLISSNSPVFGLDAFYSASADGTVRAWDSRSDKCYACLSQMGTNPIISLDQSGTILAIWNQQRSTISLVPLEKFPTGIIGEIYVDPQLCPKRVEKIVWGNDRLIVLDSPGSDKIVIDTLKLAIVGRLGGVVNFAVANESDDVARNGSLDITPDGRWCLAGSGDGSILAWDLTRITEFQMKPRMGPEIQTIIPIRINNQELIEQQHVPRILVANPKLGCVITGDTEIVVNIYNK